MRAGSAVVEVLRSAGVGHVFGLVGSSLVEILDALHGSDITFVGVRHEQAAAHMADAYARAGGRLGVCMATNGPGVTNLVTGIAGAQRSHAPVLVIAGASMREQRYQDAFQELDQTALFAPVTKATFDVPSARRLPDVLARAGRIALSDRPGPVVVNIPRDLLNDGVGDDLVRSAAVCSRRVQPPAPPPEAIVDAAAILRRAHRPLIIAGGGVVHAGATAGVVRLAERLGAAVVTSYAHNDAVPTRHPLVIGALGRAGSPEAGEAVRAADVVFAAGTRLGHFTTFLAPDFFAPGATLVHAELVGDEIGRRYPAEIALVGDVRAAVEALDQALASEPGGERRPNRAAIAEWRRQRAERRRAAAADDTLPLAPRTIAAVLADTLPREAVVTVDASGAAAPVYDLLDVAVPRSFLDSAEFGCVGCGLPFAIGAKFAVPDRPVVCLAGDGGFLMNAQELETAVRFRLRVVVLVLNNGSWGLEKAYQKHFYDQRYVGADFTNPPFDAFADVMGARGIRAGDQSSLAEAVGTALDDQSGPVVIDVPVDPEALPYPARTEAIPKERLDRAAARPS